MHAKTIAVAVAEPDATVRLVGSITNEPKAIRKLMEKLGVRDESCGCATKLDRPVT